VAVEKNEIDGGESFVDASVLLEARAALIPFIAVWRNLRRDILEGLAGLLIIDQEKCDLSQINVFCSRDMLLWGLDLYQVGCRKQCKLAKMQ
jgi:hypothetical protein